MEQSTVEWLKFQLCEVERNLINKTFLDIKGKTLAGNMLRDIFNEAKEIEKNKNEIYKECFEMFIPYELWDEANKFLSLHNSGLAKEIYKKEK
jgi:hypothetical protein